MISSLWGEIFELVHDAYFIVIASLLALTFFGSVLYLIANRTRSGLAALLIRGIPKRKHRTLRDHPAICAACGYPRGEGDTCPECGASLTEPGAVLYRDVIEAGRLPVPRWLRLIALLLVLTFAAWVFAPLASRVGNKIEWGAWQVIEAHHDAEYTVRAAQGSPTYKVQLNTSYVVDADTSNYAGPLDGYVYVILNDSTTNDYGWLDVDAIDHTWQFRYYRGGIQAAGFRATSTSAGVGIESGIAELYRATGFDQFWVHSPAELADLQRLGKIALGPSFRTIEDPSSLTDSPSSLIWSRATVLGGTQTWVSARYVPLSSTAGVFGLIVLALPVVWLPCYTIWRLVRR